MHYKLSKITSGAWKKWSEIIKAAYDMVSCIRSNDIWDMHEKV